MGMNEKILVQSYTQSKDTYGAVDAGTWATTYTLWADIQQVSGTENYASDMPVYNDVKKFVVHYTKGITAKMRISWNSQIYNIWSISDKDYLLTEILATAQDDD